MDKLISIIVPVYGVEEYLEKCVNSIINQTYKNLQIILVDDGSKDKCPEICDNLSLKDSRIKVIHKPNGGLSSARNAGLDIAEGEYIGFVDSDDFIEENMYEKLIQSALSDNADIVICGYQTVDENGKILEKYNVSNEEKIDEIMSVNEAQDSYFSKKDVRGVFVVAWNKLYKKNLFDNIRFPDGRIHEDEAVTYKVLYNSNVIKYLNDCLYNYMLRNDSIMAMEIKENRFALFEAFLERIDFYNINKEFVFRDKMISHYMRMLCQYAKWSKNKNSNEKLIKKYKEKLVNYVGDKKIKLYGIKKVEFIMFRCFSIYYFIWKHK